MALMVAQAIQRNPSLRPVDVLPFLQKNPKKTLAFKKKGLPSDKEVPVLDPLLAFQQLNPNHVS